MDADKRGGILEKRSLSRILGGKFAAAAVAILGLCLIGTLAVGGTISAQADKFDSSKRCSITLNTPERSGQYKDMPSLPDPLVYNLYKVASAEQIKSNDAYSFAATTDFKSLESNFEELGKLNAYADGGLDAFSAKYAEIAQSATKLVKDGNIEPVSTTDVNKPTSDLGSGLYLVLIHGNNPQNATDYIVEAASGNGSLATMAKSKTNEFLFTPQLVAVPGRSDGFTNNMANRVDWSYDVEATAKPEWHPLYGDLEIVKTLRSYENGKPATFVFEITGYDDDNQVVYSNTASVVFNGAGSNSAIVKHIPAGIRVVVKEVYTGASYELVSSATQDKTIVADKTVSVDFENDYNGSGNSGGSVTNSFSYGSNGDNASDAHWVWSKDGEEQN